MNYLLRDKKNDIELDDIKIYDVYLPICKGICYNESDENKLNSMLAFLQAESFEEMKIIANNNVEALKMEKDLEDLIIEHKYPGVYNREKVIKKMMNSERLEGIEEGIERGSHNKAIETAKKMKDNGLDMDMIIKCTSLSKEEIEKL